MGEELSIADALSLPERQTAKRACQILDQEWAIRWVKQLYNYHIDKQISLSEVEPIGDEIEIIFIVHNEDGTEAYSHVESFVTSWNFPNTEAAFCAHDMYWDDCCQYERVVESWA